MNYYQLVNEISSYTQNTFTTADINTFIAQTEQRVFNTVQFPNIRKNVTGSVSANNQYLSCPIDFLSVYSIAVIDTTGAYHYLLNKDVNFIREAYPSSATGQGLPVHYAIFGPQSSLPTALSLMLGPTPDQGYVTELHYFFYPPSIVPGEITAVTQTAGGALYTSGTFYNATLTGGTGSGATAILTIVGGVVTSVAIQTPGFGYAVGDVLSYSDNSGAGFFVTVTAINQNNGQSWLGDNFDMVLLYGSLVEAYTFMKGEEDMIKLYDAKYKEALGMAKRAGDGLERMDSYRSGQARQRVQ